MMKILCAVAISLAAATVRAAPEPGPAPALPFATWHMADLQDVTQAWYFTGAALSSQDRDGAPWADEQPALRSVEAVLAPPPPVTPATPAVPASITVPPTLPEPKMASMLLVGLVLIMLRVSRKEDRLG